MTDSTTPPGVEGMGGAPRPLLRLTVLLPFFALAAACTSPGHSAPDLDALRPVLAAGPDDTEEETPAPPRFHPTRFLEDYSYLREHEARTWRESLKQLSLESEGDWRLSFGGELQAQYEFFDDDAWGADPEADHDYVWARALPYVDLESEGLRIFAQGIIAYEIGDEAEARPIDENRGDLLQVFAEIRPPLEGLDLTLRVGRQLMGYGSERLIGTRYGPNVPQPFDAAVATLSDPDWSFDLFYARPVDVDLGRLDDRTSRDESLWSAYFTHRLPSISPDAGFDAYYIGYENESARFDQGTGRELRHTLGLRFFGSSGGWDWNAEAFGQFGRFEGSDIRAWSVGTETGFRFTSLPLRPRLALRTNIISGDRDPEDDTLETFNPLFPKGKYFSEIGIVGPFNLINLHPILQLELAPRWTLDLGVSFYWRESTEDGFYNNGGRLLRSGADTRERYIGTQYDIALIYRPDGMTSFLWGYTALDAGAFIEETGPSRTIHYATFEVRIVF